jgi:hypothetical protein
MKVQRLHLPPLNTAVHRLEDGMNILSGPVLGEREYEERRLERLIASAERVIVMSRLPVFCTGYSICYLLPAFQAMETGTMSHARWIERGQRFAFLLAYLDVDFVGGRSIQPFFVQWRLKHNGRPCAYAGVALILGVLLSRGHVRSVLPQPVHSWSLPLFLLGMASASWVILTWYTSGAAISRPVFPRTVTLPFRQAQQIEKGLEQAYTRKETLHQEKVKSLAKLEYRRLISTPLQDFPPLLRAQVCLICRKGKITTTRYAWVSECGKRSHRLMHRIHAQNNRARKPGLPATMKLPEYLITFGGFRNHGPDCQRTQASVIEHALPLVRGYQEGGKIFEHCFPACRAGNAETSHKHPHQEGGRR